jgi:hypothetical protein
MRSKRAGIHQQLKRLIRALVKLNPLKTKEQKSLIGEIIWYLILPGVMIAFSILLGIYLLTVGFSGYPAAADFWNKALSTTGVITETTKETYTIKPSAFSFTSSHTYYASTVRFQTEQGQIAEFKANDICQSPHPDLCSGKQVQVLYAFDNPQLSMIKGGDSPLDRTRTKIGWGIIILLGSVFILVEALPACNERFSPTQRRR